MLRVGRTGIALLVLAQLHFHFHHHFHGPPVDYVALAAAAAASWAGFPGPGEPLLILAGVFAAKHKLDIVEVVLVAWAAATIGGEIGWYIGLKAGRTVLTRPGPLHSLRLGTVRRGERAFKRHAVPAILLTPAWVAGINDVRPVVYHLTNVISAAIWAAGIGFGAYLIGPAIADSVEDLGLVSAIVLVVAVVAIVALEIRHQRRRRARRATPANAGGTPPAPAAATTATAVARDPSPPN